MSAKEDAHDVMIGEVLRLQQELIAKMDALAGSNVGIHYRESREKAALRERYEMGKAVAYEEAARHLKNLSSHVFLDGDERQASAMRDFAVELESWGTHARGEAERASRLPARRSPEEDEPDAD